MDAIVERLVTYISETNYDGLPKDVIDETKKFILDTLGVGLAGAREPGCKEVVDLVKKWSSNNDGSTIIYYGDRVSPPEAAFTNSVMMHALDFDDTFDSSAMHAHVSSLPAALAIAEWKGQVNGKEFITAVALGVDITCRIGSAILSPLSWIRTATCGSFGAAASTAKILNGGEKEILNTLGIVYSQTAGNAQCLVDGGLVKRMQPGFSARSAVLSAALASQGVTGATNVFMGEYGFFKLYEGGKVKEEKVTENLGDHFGVMDLSIKPYPCCRMTHASIDAALELYNAQHIDLEGVAEIVVYVSKMVSDMVGGPFTIRSNPQVDAQFSIPYTVAVALKKGEVFLNDFNSDTIKKDSSLFGLAKKIRVLIDPELSANDISSANMVIRMLNGKSISFKVNTLKGSPLRPMTFNECADKFKKCIEYSQKSSLIKTSGIITDFIFNLEKKKDVGEIFDYV
ncbi:MAG: MmgE/PrpD family protein [Deltaproteobacteria bacterium]|nr:MmgE/PrpD family protein [Deltaproteobacteria bacterium]